MMFGRPRAGLVAVLLRCETSLFLPGVRRSFSGNFIHEIILKIVINYTKFGVDLLTRSLMSRIWRTRVGPSVVTRTDRNPEPGRSRCLPTRCSIGGGLQWV